MIYLREVSTQGGYELVWRLSPELFGGLGMSPGFPTHEQPLAGLQAYLDR